MSSTTEAVKQQEEYFNSRMTIPLENRIKTLKKLKDIILEREDAICEALYKDIKKPRFESMATETQFALAELNHIIKNLKLWARPKRVSASLSNFPSKDYIKYEPYGQVLVISPWNYPFMLAISPLIGAIAAGNTVVLKPSELSPATSSILADLIGEVFDDNHVKVIKGGVEVSQELLDLKWDYIFFTGSTRVGRIVYQSAAKHLTPVTLELGGKNPCIVDESAAIKLAARRIAWGKFINAGQTCLAPDYLLVQQTVKTKLIDELKKAITKFYGEHTENSEDFARIATKGQYERLKKMIQESDVVLGGQFNDNDQYIAPTLIDNPSVDSYAMEDEIFGPVLPILTYADSTELDKYLNHYSKPLALYVFSKRKSFQKKMMSNYSFGGGTINDTVVHISNKNLPFGGVGHSGMGGYHGKHSFELFSHKKSISKRGTWLDLPLRYPPYTSAIRLAKMDSTSRLILKVFL